MTLDSFDRRILALLQDDAATPQRVISEKVNLSSSAVNRRIAALFEAGVARRQTVIVDPAKVGRPITVIVEVTVESERLDHLDAVRDRLVACPAVNQVYYVTGEVDFVVILTARDMGEYEALTRELFFAEGNVKRFRTLVVMDRAKVSLDVPLEE
ncbi:Lrp/AsnC family transcriptional regulator [Alsobacter sp. SYSU M60028]|uniref:Lrp/AsnC family transcriptional regulator n=1 Tax=Alsobacter ponti TaxID=2962936 RepID=A0ABT1L7T6_9HYPH|nr:Lrp/AsnC family transcriptional regulator [Alsobacter ponti]MCP8937540.1 Lrp/AsnC family transcriptional regulator [Alsobacter ponti]